MNQWFFYYTCINFIGNILEIYLLWLQLYLDMVINIILQKFDVFVKIGCYVKINDVFSPHY